MSTLNITRLVDEARVSRFQLGIASICIALAFVDGFDLVAITFAAPALRAQLGISTQEIGTVFSAALFGAMVGNFVCGPIGDKFGRKPVIVATTLLFSVGTLATVLSTGFTSLVAIRFLTGFGLGVANISAYALCSEYFPHRLEASVVGICTAGYTVGAALGGLLAAAIVPQFGWTSIFLVGGLLGLLMAASLAALLPESIRFLVLNSRHPEVLRIAAKIDARARSENAEIATLDEPKVTGRPIRALFATDRRALTILLWIMCFMNFIELFFIQQWLPSLASATGSSFTTAARLGSVLQIGGLTGALCFAWLLRGREKPFGLFAIGFLLGGTSFVLLSNSIGEPTALMACVFLTGVFVPGLQTALNGIVSAQYPTEMRSTGLSWAIAVGRLGSVIGPIAAGLLLARAWTPQHVLASAALPAVCAATAALTLFLLLASQSRRTTI
jgi:MFS transporter, AAHS family, 4-hydroxybenzoate transporter